MTFYLHLSEKLTPTSSNPQYRKNHKLNVPVNLVREKAAHSRR